MAGKRSSTQQTVIMFRKPLKGQVIDWGQSPAPVQKCIQRFKKQGPNIYTQSALGRNLFMASINSRVDYSKKNLFQYSYLLYVLYNDYCFKTAGKLSFNSRIFPLKPPITALTSYLPSFCCSLMHLNHQCLPQRLVLQ